MSGVEVLRYAAFTDDPDGGIVVSGRAVPMR